MAKPNFQYKPREAAAWDKHASQTGSSFIGFIKDEFTTYSIRDGENHGRIMPPTWENPEHYGVEVWVHYRVGPQNATVLCLAKMGKGKCPECELRNALDDAGRPDADDHKPNRRVAVWWIDRKEPDAKKSLCVWAMPWTMDRDISKLAKDPLDGSLYHLDHPEEGFDIFFDVTGNGKTAPKQYGAAQLARRPTGVSDDALAYVIAHPLPTTLQWRSYAEVQQLMEGGGAAPATGTTAAPTTTATATTTEDLRPARAEAPAPQPAAVTYCDHTIKMQGKLLACTLAPGHGGDCDYGRVVGEYGGTAANPQPLGADTSTAAPQGTTRIAPRPVTSAPSAAAPATEPAPAAPSEGKSRADLLRERFKKG
jgi:hypothetical protein